MSFVDPEIPGLLAEVQLHRHDVLTARIADCARRDPALEARVRELCVLELPASNRLLLSKVMSWFGTPEAVAAALNLINDGARPPIEL